MAQIAKALVVLFMICAATAALADARQMEDESTVVLRTIDKLSARTHTFDVPVEKTVKFGNSLFIKARACRKASPLDKPESAAFLQIWERKPADEKSRWLFSGWMFASSPSLSSLDHPIYDVWVIDCKNAVTSKSEEFSSETAPAQAPETQASAAAPPKPVPPAGDAALPVRAETPAPKPAEAPAGEDAAKPAGAPAAFPPLEQLPGSFEEGEEGIPGDGN